MPLTLAGTPAINGLAVPTDTLSSGLVLVTPTSVAYSGGSASLSGAAVSFSGVSSISLNGCFTSTYDNYLIVTNSKTAATNQDVKLRFRVAGTDASGASDYNRRYLLASSTTVQTGTSANAEFSCLTADTNSGQANYTINNPFGASPTLVNLQGSSTTAVSTVAGYHSLSTSYDGFTLFVSAGDITGKLRVYGYRNS